MNKTELVKELKVRNYTDGELLNKVKSVDGFKGIPKGLWILGVRSASYAPDLFLCKFYVFIGKRFIMVLSGTTRPGLPYLLGLFKKFNNKGVAVVRSNRWYYDLWKYRKTFRRGRELAQVGKIQLSRDGNMNRVVESYGSFYKGLFGIHFHPKYLKFTSYMVSLIIGKSSAGCQVTNDMKGCERLFNMVEERLKLRVQTFIPYCLIDEF